MQERIFYEEMQTAVAEMKNGVSEMEAIRRFGIRCMMPEIKKFSATVIQGIQKVTVNYRQCCRLRVRKCGI